MSSNGNPNSNPDHNPDANAPAQEPPPRNRSLNGDLYVYTDADLQDIAAEVYAHLHDHPHVDDLLADQIANLVYDLHTGDWLSR